MMDSISFAEEGQIGLVTLNRPQALNALTLDMIQALQQQLLTWESNPNICAVVIRGEGEKAFCAGGDVRWLYEAGLSHNPQQMQFFWHEYRLNHYINRYPKPYIALMDGITMGGGVGVSLHGSYPVATERFVFAMPETSIGFFPDIGASYLLSRCPDAVGLYLGLTGNRISAEDAYALELIKAVVPSESIEKLLHELINRDLSNHPQSVIDDCIKQFAKANSQAPIEEQRKVIKDCFSRSSVEDIFNALNERGDDWSTTILNSLHFKAPLSLKITFAQIHKAASLNMAQCMAMDYCLVSHFMQGHDFYEGVRALLIDKDKSPRWQPSTLNQVSDAMVMEYFAGNEELILII
nr:enoyl-CoA hydratase/isomerase family protein [Legionella jordanis]